MLRLLYATLLNTRKAMQVSVFGWMFVERMEKKYTTGCKSVCSLKPDVRCRHLVREGAFNVAEKKVCTQNAGYYSGQEKMFGGRSGRQGEGDAR